MSLIAAIDSLVGCLKATAKADRQLTEILKRIEERIMATQEQIDAIKAAQAETQASLVEQGTALAEIGTDLDALIALANTPGVDLTDLVTNATAIRDSVKSVTDAAKAAAAKFDPALPPPV